MTTNAGTVMDASGLVSATNFPHAQLFNGSAGLTTTSTSYVDVSGSSLSTLVFDRTVSVLVYLMSYGYNDSAVTSNLGDDCEMILYDSFTGGSLANTLFFGTTATNVQNVGSVTNFTLSMANEMTFQMAVLQMDAGTHNLKLQWKVAGGGTGHLDAWLLGYMVLGT